MTDMQTKPRRIEDDPHVLEVYGNKVINASYDGGAVVVTIGATRLLPERIDEAPQQSQQPVIHVTARLALSPTAARELINALNNILDVITKRAAPEAASQKPS
jgi:hypothetical protein